MGMEIEEIDSRDEMEADSFWKENYPMIMQATRLHIESTGEIPSYD